jgi:hypothetical protein
MARSTRGEGDRLNSPTSHISSFQREPIRRVFTLYLTDAHIEVKMTARIATVLLILASAYSLSCSAQNAP